MTKDLNFFERLEEFLSGRKVVSTVRISASAKAMFWEDELLIKGVAGGESDLMLNKGEAMLLAREIVRNYGLGPGGSSLIKELNER